MKQMLASDFTASPTHSTSMRPDDDITERDKEKTALAIVDGRFAAAPANNVGLLAGSKQQVGG